MSDLIKLGHGMYISDSSKYSLTLTITLLVQYIYYIYIIADVYYSIILDISNVVAGYYGKYI